MLWSGNAVRCSAVQCPFPQAARGPSHRAFLQKPPHNSTPQPLSRTPLRPPGHQQQWLLLQGRRGRHDEQRRVRALARPAPARPPSAGLVDARAGRCARAGIVCGRAGPSAGAPPAGTRYVLRRGSAAVFAMYRYRAGEGPDGGPSAQTRGADRALPRLGPSDAAAAAAAATFGKTRQTTRPRSRRPRPRPRPRLAYCRPGTAAAAPDADPSAEGCS